MVLVGSKGVGVRVGAMVLVMMIVIVHVMAHIWRGWRGWGRGGAAGMRDIESIGIGVHALWDGNTLELVIVDWGSQTFVEYVLLGVIANEMELLVVGGDAEGLLDETVGFVSEGRFRRGAGQGA
jgi:hypothetical protein